MRNIAKLATAAALVGAMALATTPSQAEHGRNAAAAIGFGAGALVGAAAASNAYNGPDYAPGYYGRDDGYQPGYASEAAPAYEPAYAYERGPMSAPASCWVSTDNTRGFGYRGSCASQTKDTDAATLGQARRNVSVVRP